MHLYLIEFTVADWAASIAWYRDRFGLPLLLLDEPNRYGLFDAGPAQIALKAGRRVAGTTIVTFQVASLDREVARLADRGILPVESERASAEGYNSARYQDPDGHRLVLFEWTGPGAPPGGRV